MNFKMRRLFLTIFILCSITSFLFYWLLYLEAITINKTDIEKDNLLNHKLEERLSALETGLKENQVVLNILNTKIRNYVNKLRSGKGFLPSPRADLCNSDRNEKSIPINLTSEQLYEKLPFDNPDGGVWKQGFDIKIDEERFNGNKPLKVFVVPHSHNDPGWLKTFDQYYRDQTEHILDNMIRFLPEQKMSFIWAEVVYFAKWFDGLKSEDQKETVKSLLDAGQLEIVTGGWVMTDEANTHYFAMISQMVDGHEWLLHNLNYRPKHGWAIDPFGHSPTMAFLLKRMGLRGMVIQRIHYAIKKWLSQNKFLEFNWKQSFEPSNFVENSKGILCHVMPFYSYDAPHSCGPDPKVCCQYDFARNKRKMACPWGIQPKAITDSNVEERALKLLDQYKKKAMLYGGQNQIGGNLLVPLGDDFRYDKLEEWKLQYQNYQKIFDYINAKPELNTEIKFATLNDYFEATLNDRPIESSPSYVGDFFSYADKDDNYWTGYFVSRPFYKKYDRIVQYHLRGAELLFSFYSILNVKKFGQNTDLVNDLINARAALSLFQHHDAITGTSKTFVVADYAKRLHSAIKSSQKIISTLSSLLFYLPISGSLEPPISFMDQFPLDNTQTESVLELSTESGKDYWSLFLYNTLSKQRNEMICFKLSTKRSYILRDPQGKLVSQLQITADKEAQADEACFRANLKPVSVSQYSIELNSLNSNYEQSKIIEGSLAELQSGEKDFDFTIQSDKIKLIFDNRTGMLSRYVDLADENEEHPIEVHFMTYGTRRHSKERSGAYLFLPDSEKPSHLQIKSVRMQIVKGSLMSRVTTFIDAGFIIEHQITIQGSDAGHLTFEIQNKFHLGVRTFANRELVMRLRTDIKNKNRFYTDLNGFQMQSRTYLSKLPLQGNVYPASTVGYIEDLKSRINIITGQPLGMTSSNSNMDFFCDRVLTSDDLRGLNSGITDNKPTTELFRVVIERTANEATKLTLNTQLEIDRLLNPVIKMRSTSQSSQSGVEFLANELPCDLHLLNFRTNLNTMGTIGGTIYNMFLHRYQTSCETKCFDSESLRLNQTLTQNVLNSLDEKAETVSLSATQKLNDLNLVKDDLFISDLTVLRMKLKE